MSTPEMQRSVADPIVHEELTSARAQITASASALREELVRRADWREWVRRRPVVFVAAALALGFVLGRRAVVKQKGRVAMNTQAWERRTRQMGARVGPKLENTRQRLTEASEGLAKFARTQPTTALFSALALGFIVGRIAARR